MKTSFIVICLGSWGRGLTLKEAAQNCQKAGGRKKDRACVRLITGDDEPSFDGMSIRRLADSESHVIGDGFKLGQLLSLEGGGK